MEKCEMLIFLIILICAFRPLHAIQQNVCMLKMKPECDCFSFVSLSKISIYCDSLILDVMNVKDLFNMNEIFFNQEIVVVSISNAALLTIEANSFIKYNLKSIELADNMISNINYDAFHGLENSLVKLDLSGNEFNAIPTLSIAKLRELNTLLLNSNEIDGLYSSPFNVAEFPNLRHLELSNNMIKQIGAKAFYPLNLHALSLEQNGLRLLKRNSLPESLVFLNLNHNDISNFPYMALANLKELKSLNLAINTISTIERNENVIFNLPHLQLFLNYNNIKKLGENAFDSFMKLDNLDLSNNEIVEINAKSFNSMTSLKKLDLSNNLISNIPYNTFHKFATVLEKLNLKGNKIKFIPFALRQLSGLQKLNLNKNKLASLSSESLTKTQSKLTHLHLSLNRLTSIPAEMLCEMNRLQILDLSKNFISEIERITCENGSNGFGSNLVELDLSGNAIKEIVNPGAFPQLSSLSKLDLSFNLIKRLTRGAMERLESLEFLYLSNNDITEFPRNALSSLRKLRYLILDHNQIVNLPNYAFQWLIHLQVLSIAFNRIHTLNEKTFHSTSAIQVQVLNLGFNEISTMQTAAFENLPNIEILKLNNNRLTTLKPQIISSLRKLRRLSLANNQINETQEGAFDNLPLLSHLSLENNRLRTMKEGIFRRVPHLIDLNLSYNRIESFDLDFLEQSVNSLRILDLSHNVIRKLDVSATKASLIHLNVQHNQLELIGAAMFGSFKHLKQIDLSNNDLIEIDENAFLNSPHLQNITLANNNLRIIRGKTFTSQNYIQMLDLSNNAFSSLGNSIFGENNVKNINLKNNNFSSVPARAFQTIRGSLSVLDLSYNSIRSIRWSDFTGLTNITKLLLSHNHIEIIDDEAFAKMPFLQSLDLSNNPITSWAPNAFKGLSSRLKHLNLASTGLFSFPQLSVKHLNTLNLSHNNIYEIRLEDMGSLKKLVNLDLSYNNLLDIKIYVSTQITIRNLNISGNSLRSIHDLLVFKELETLNMSDMKDMNISEPHLFSTFRQLKNLYLYNLPNFSSYKIADIFQYLPRLKELHFEYNAERLPGSLLDNLDSRFLSKLTISGAKIKEIDPSAFESIRSYDICLTIRDTSLSAFPLSAIQRMTDITTLKLELINNKLETFNPFLMSSVIKPPIINRDGVVLYSINLSGNPIECDCRLKWLRDWVEISPSDMSSLHETICSEHSRRILEKNNDKLNGKVFTVLDFYKKYLALHPRGDNGDGIAMLHCNQDGRLLSAQSTNRQLNKWKLATIVVIMLSSALSFY